MVDDLHNLYLQSILDLFNKYKAVAGYPNAQLEIVWLIIVQSYMLVDMVVNMLDAC